MASPSTSQNNIQSDGPFPELLVIQAFHIFTINSLSQAKLEGLLDEDTLASAEADVMISGPALCLFFAALRSKTSPPSVPIPSSASGTTAQLFLSAATCPPVFLPFFRLWAQTVPAIQALPSESQHDLARIICDKPPLQTQPPGNTNGNQPSSTVHLMRIAADLRAVAIEITQRRTFQERYKMDLQSALDAGRPALAPGEEKRRVASFVPPPTYNETLSWSSPSPSSSAPSSPQKLPASIPTTPSRLNAALPSTPNFPSGTEGMQSLDSVVARQPSQPNASPLTVNRASSPAGLPRGRTQSIPPSPTLLPPDAPAITLIRETLYAALGEVIATTPSIVSMLQTDPPRAYFSTVALAILTVSTDCLTINGGVITPLGRELTLADCPPAYRPLMLGLGEIGKQAKKMVEEDDERAIQLARSGSTETFEPRMERLRSMLEKGVAAEEERYDAVVPPASASASATPTLGPAQAQTQEPTPPLPPRRKKSPSPAMPVPTTPEANSQASGTPVAHVSSRLRGPPFTTREEDQQLLNPTGTSSSGSNSNTSSPRSSGEHTRGARNVLHKPKPPIATTPAASANTHVAPTTPPAVASKPPPAARYAPPTTPPPTRGANNNKAGVGAGSVGAALVNAPRAAMMTQPVSSTPSGSPYDQALGSGARIAGADSGVVRVPPLQPPGASSAPVPSSAAAAAAAGVLGSDPASATVPPVPAESSNPRRSLQGSTIQFANRINALALNMTRLRMFQERQDMVFNILASVRD